MNFLKKHIEIISESTFLLFIYMASQLPMRDFDIWFHMKAGELMWSRGAVEFVDRFSHSAQGREWIPFEWLFQVIVYLLSRIGLWTLPLFIGFFIVFFFFFFFRILAIFRIPLGIRLLSAFFLFVAAYEFNTVRPHVLAYAFVVFILYCIFTRVYEGKRKWLYFSIPLTLFWTHIHSTAFLSWGLLVSYAFLAAFYGFFTKRKDLFAVSKDLVMVAVLNFFVTLSPPTGIADYRLLWMFYRDQKFLGTFIEEWGPISQDNPLGYYIYITSFALSIGMFLFVSIRKKTVRANLLWAPPLLLMAIMGFVAVRNIVLGTIAIVLLFAYALSQTRIVIQKRTHMFTYRLVIAILVVFHIWLFLVKRHEYASQRLFFPVQSTEFVKRYLNGKMFNDYGYGGYILYHVYPRLQVYIDGRAEVYLCCEMRDYINLAYYKNLPDEEYRNYLTSYWNDHDISFAILSSRKHSVMRKMGRILSSDPKWVLVFWDDDSQVFVKRDGKNDDIIKQLGSTYATPYLKDPFYKEKIQEARMEYERMDTVAHSARTHNAIGYIHMLSGEFDRARDRFNMAVDQDPSFESPYMNLGELAARDGQMEQAIGLYQKALGKAPDRGMIYIRLGTMLLEYTHDREKAIAIWQNGIKNTVDDDAKRELTALVANESGQTPPIGPFLQ